MGKRDTVASLVVLALLLGIVAAASPAEQAEPEKLTLQSKYTPGNYYQTMKIEMDQLIRTPQQPPQKVHSSQRWVTGVRIFPPDEKGNTRMLMQFKQIRMDTDAGQMQMHFDSAKPSAQQTPDIARIMDPLRKQVIELVADPEGKVTCTKGLDTFWENQAAKASSPATAAMVQALAEALGGEALAKRANEEARFLPDKPVGVGDRWKFDYPSEVPNLGTLQLKGDCKVKSVKQTPLGPLALIEYKGRMTKEDEPKEMNFGGARMKLTKLTSTLSGSVKFNTEFGMAVAAETKQDMNMSWVIPNPRGRPMPCSLQMHIGMTNSVTQSAKPVIEE